MEEEKIVLLGQPLISWQIDDFVKHNRSKRWYFFGGLISLSLIIYSIATANFLLAVIILMSSIIILMNSFVDPEKIEITITTLGILIDRKFYEYTDLKSFSLVYKPPEVNNLYLEFKSLFHPLMSVPLNDLNPNIVRDYLLNYLDENLDQDIESLTDYVRRMYKL